MVAAFGRGGRAGVWRRPYIWVWWRGSETLVSGAAEPAEAAGIVKPPGATREIGVGPSCVGFLGCEPRTSYRALGVLGLSKCNSVGLAGTA
jgi:hypothetical protein